MNPRRPVYVTPGRHPFEVAPLTACALVGATMALGHVRPPALAAGLPEPLMTGWLALVAAGGVVGLLGAYWRGSVDDGLLVEFAGVVCVGAACTLYVAALFATNPPAIALAAGGLLAGLAGGAWGRAWQCLREWRRVHRGEVTQVSIDLPLLTEEGRPDPDEPGAGASA